MPLTLTEKDCNRPYLTENDQIHRIECRSVQVNEKEHISPNNIIIGVTVRNLRTSGVADPVRRLLTEEKKMKTRFHMCAISKLCVSVWHNFPPLNNRTSCNNNCTLASSLTRFSAVAFLSATAAKVSWILSVAP